MFRRILAPLAALLVLGGCILVDDFTPKWEDARTDSCTAKIAQSLYYSEFRRDPEGKDINTLARSFTLGKYQFLLLKKDASDKGGRMYRFHVVNGIFQRYRLDPAMKKQFQQDYPNAPVSLAHDTVEIKSLGAEEMKLLTDINTKDEYWEIEDQTLYNTLRNPTCIYEDRDLAGDAAKDKAAAEKQKRIDAQEAKEKAAAEDKAKKAKQ
jgi:hypothetical protein